jgi:hypothetical protein
MPFGNSTFSDLGTAVSDIFAAKGDELKAEGARFEQSSYLEAADLAKQNEAFTAMSTAIKQSQADRNLYQALGQTKADVAGAGFAQSGSALDLLRESASQGAMKAVLGEQGLITEAGYQEQAQSYTDMASAAGVAIEADKLAAKGSTIAAGFSFAAAAASLLPNPAPASPSANHALQSSSSGALASDAVNGAPIGSGQCLFFGGNGLPKLHCKSSRLSSTPRFRAASRNRSNWSGSVLFRCFLCVALAFSMRPLSL